jgi:hypothetical protein
VCIDRSGFGWVQRFKRRPGYYAPGVHERGPGDSAIHELTRLAARISAAVPVGNRQIVRAGFVFIHRPGAGTCEGPAPVRLVVRA